MTTSENVHGITRAIRYCISTIRALGSIEGTVLPGFRSLAAQAEVAPVTMLKAAGFLREKGIIEGGQGKRYRIAAAAGKDLDRLESEVNSPDKSHKPLISSPSGRLAQMIARDIDTGVYDGPGPLPPMKELAGRYGTTYYSLKKALSRLESEGRIIPFKSGYVVAAVQVAKSSASITFLIHGHEAAGGLMLPPLAQKFLSPLEAECARMRLDLKTTGFLVYRGKEKLEFWNAHQGAIQFSDLHDSFGAIVFVTAADHSLHALLKMLPAVKMPVAFIDIAGEWNVPDSMAGNSVAFFSYVAGQEPGRAAGEYLLRAGHKKIAFISPFHAASWSRLRLKGLQLLFNAQGGAVVSYVKDNPPDMTWHYEAEATATANYGNLYKAYKSWAKASDSRIAQSLDHLFSYELPRRMLPRLLWRQKLDELFEQALADKPCTAWVAANDDVAVAAMDFLKKRGVKVPQRISILGFDDTFESLQHGVTSYNFDMRTHARLALNFVTGKKILKNNEKPGRVPGIIIERSSTRKIR
ncbi:MAG: GntR family transcriptional regulator [Chitinivibrionales bacterium]|nr:GntR family transcriptional regulator [Chitinivibrionales bacterium]